MVHLFVYGDIDLSLNHEAYRQNVTVHRLGSYADSFAAYGNRKHAFTEFKTLHKFRLLRCLPLCEQVLYLDCDTFFFADVEQLFRKYQFSQFAAREEVMTRGSHYGYNPQWIDETGLDQIAAELNVRRVTAFNTGVCMMNRKISFQISDLYEQFLDYAWRLLVAACLKLDPHLQVVADHLTEHDRINAISNYPASSIWIFEEVAMWLTLGHIPNLRDAVIEPSDVVQGSECDAIPANTILAHYWSAGQTKFFNQRWAQQ